MVYLKPEFRVILDIDSPTREQIYKSLTHLRKQEREGRSSLLFLPAPQKKIVGCCGKEKFQNQLVRYYGEEFCTDCVEKWKAGS